MTGVRNQSEVSGDAALSIALFALTLVLAFALCSNAAAQQSKKIPRIGYTDSSGSPASPSPLLDVFRQTLRDLGYTEGKNILIEVRYAEGRLDRIPTLVKELIQENIDVFVAENNVAISAAKEATKTIPIVMLSSIDPVAAGYVHSLARPGVNVTGLAHLTRELSAKRLELLRETLPRISQLGILWVPDGPGPKVAFKEYQAAARTFKLDLQSLEVRGPIPDFEGAFKAAKIGRRDALIIVRNPLTMFHNRRIMELAIKSRLPSMTESTQDVNAGGLISYGVDRADLHRRAASYVDKILKGANPADLPVEQPMKFELAVNLKTAKQIGVTIPQSVLFRADKVIK